MGGIYQRDSAVINIGLNWWWIPQYGMMGAALATLVSYLIMWYWLGS
ncbi:MAG: polysaccharide biosynthesis C-terminal domain-containing protein [Patescibacteria group bacterium]